MRVLSVDTSDTASGGGEFIKDGELWSLKGDTGVHLRLSAAQALTSSTYRELIGILALDLRCIPSECRRAVVICDSQAAVHVLSFGSRGPPIQELV